MLNKNMKTKYIIALSSLLAFAACQKTILPEESVASKSGKVTIQVPVRVPDAEIGTRAFGETPAFETAGLYVVVYEGGYRCEVVKAEVNGAPTTDVNGSFVYNYDLTLTTSANPRNLHFISIGSCSETTTLDDFIANWAPFEENRIGSELYTSNDVDAYWQRVKLDRISDVPEILKSDIGTVTMIRNFAKITLNKDNTQVPDTKFEFADKAYKVFNTPSRGHIAPYIVSGTNAGYVDGYETLDYADAYDQYPGKIPVGATLAGYTAADDGGETFIPYDEAAYMYERPVPTDASAAFIIVKGYYEESTTPCYYKINLMDGDDKYYALLRGFRFKINIEKVTGPGCATVEEAVKSAGSGNISTSLSYIDVTNISDGNCRLFVSATSVTTIKSTTVTIKYKFLKTASDPTSITNEEVDFANSTDDGIEVIVNEPEDDGEPSIKKTGDIYNVNVFDGAAYIDADGYNYITIETTNHENVYKEQVVTIRGRATNGSPAVTTTIQRDIHIIVRPTLKLAAECLSTNTTSAINNVTITLGVEPNLPSSIFPLQFRIEAQCLTLTPDNSQPNNNMPVESGISAKTGKPSFYYVKTIDYDTYTHASTAPVNGVDGMKKFDCYFKENTKDGKTPINVSHDLFNLAECNYAMP